MKYEIRYGNMMIMYEKLSQMKEMFAKVNLIVTETSEFFNFIFEKQNNFKLIFKRLIFKIGYDLWETVDIAIGEIPDKRP